MKGGRCGRPFCWSSEERLRIPLEYRHRFDMAGMRKHVDDTRRAELVAVSGYEHGSVPSERCRIARDVHDPARCAVARQRLDERDGAFAWRIDQDLVEGSKCFDGVGRGHE